MYVRMIDESDDIMNISAYTFAAIMMCFIIGKYILPAQFLCIEISVIYGWMSV